MTTKRIAYTRPDGGVSFATPAPQARLVSALKVDGKDLVIEDGPVPVSIASRVVRASLTQGAATVAVVYAEDEATFVERVRTASVPQDATDVCICDLADIEAGVGLAATGKEADRSFREAWKLDPSDPAKPVKVDMAAARTIHMDRIRDVRDGELLKKDKAWMRAFALKDQTLAAQIEAERQVLRDLPQAFDLRSAGTAKALKELWPAELPPG